MMIFDQDPEKIFFLAMGLINYAPIIFRAVRSVFRKFVIVIVILPDR